MDACINWTGFINKDGYGQRGRYMAHRVAWEKAHGPIPAGMTVDHLCFNSSCVRVEHMRLLTPLENARNQQSAHKTHCTNGHEFTPENTYIRPRRHRSGTRDCRACIRDRAARYKAKRAAA